MDTKDKRLEEYIHPEGMEVKMKAGWINGRGVVLILMVVIIGSWLFNYIWGKGSAFDSGHQLGYAIKYIGIVCILFGFAGYILIQYAVLYYFSGRDRHALQWKMDQGTWRFLLVKPMALKYYRVALLLPFLVMGLLPMLHGFCMGNPLVYYFGGYCLICSSNDFWYFLKLRSFKDEDKIVDGKRSFNATIIKETY
ncbi:DUF3267 domain-containing protein [Parabacteroides acidifaciens]|uniref:DUF3267 domain-containing protein n=1 Tax=Parabacteroides acidifaciens TaxID=2290935 RepID=A0A3D8HHP6_9BACT|nr:metalloprotease family protein [Parabacteroides acidifaciens]MBC8600771.1 DUF3267 domain-containing protein [Parabacteroides acidifaciens]RDU50499.1 DUF3267 domain-containing protein [Parabacteroides acidifaciens]